MYTELHFSNHPIIVSEWHKYAKNYFMSLKYCRFKSMYISGLYYIALLLDFLPKEYTMHTAQKIEDFSDA